MKNNIFFYFFFFIACSLIYLRLEIFYGSDLEAPFTDDFYYYLNTSRNFINTGLITFDRISITNGFQPLWFFFITFFKILIVNEIFFNSVIIFSIFLFSFFTYFNFKNFLIKNNYSEIESKFISSFISYLTLFFSKNGMEIAIAIYFFSWSLLYLKKNILIFSFLGFLTFLSRLEFLIFYFFILFHEIFYKKNIYKIKYLLKISLFPFLIMTYLILNFLIFEMFLPESGIAKSLTKELKFNKETFSFLSSKSFGMRFIQVLFILNCIGCILIFSKSVKLFTKLALTTTFVFFLSNSLRSAWPLWTWHFFFLAISTPLLINDLLNLLNFKKKYFMLAVSIFFTISYAHLFIKNHNHDNDHILNLGKKIRDYYQKENINRFAMGDMAGKVSYLLNKELIQLEGLVGGKKVLKNINNESNLCKVLIENNVEIYLTNRIKKNLNGYFEVFEPSQKSSNLKKMHTKFKNQPSKIFNSGDLKVYAFNIKKDKICDKI